MTDVGSARHLGRTAVFRYLPPVAASLLAIAAVIQVRLASQAAAGLVGGYSAAAALLGLAATLPLGLLWKYPVTAAAVISFANVLSLTGLRLLTVAGIAAQLVILYRLGRTGSQLFAAAIC